MCLTETCSGFRVGKNLSDMFRIRNGLKLGDALLSLLFKSDLEYTLSSVQVNQEFLKLIAKNSYWFMLMMLIYWVEACIL
jgi:hypothetical protein